jgi:pantoate--beta-alanine ligase
MPAARKPGERVFLALGANLGDRRANFDQALQRLAAVPGVEVMRTSDWIDTDAVGAPAGSPTFLNGVAELRVEIAPAALLALCRQLELEAGRDHAAPANAPRPLDLDVILFGARVVDTRDLTIPHPRMFEREFVMGPLAQLTDVAGLVVSPRPSVLRDEAAFAACTAGWARGDCTVGLVPTMGALHEGHLSLMRLARDECDRVAVSVFVNPMQFSPGEDLEAYPRTFDADLQRMREVGVDAVFAPECESMYGDGFCSRVGVGVEAQTMEGATRPTHFEGVTTVVAKLFNLARPTHAYFGQKDAQQCAVIRRMARDLSYPLSIRIGPIVREPDGLAMSSRNVYLAPPDRAAATVLIRGLRAARAAHRDGVRDAADLLAAARDVFAAEPAMRLDYLELRADDDLTPGQEGQPVAQGRLVVAAFFGENGDRPVRLLDNIALAGDE